MIKYEDFARAEHKTIEVILEIFLESGTKKHTVATIIIWTRSFLKF